MAGTGPDDYEYIQWGNKVWEGTYFNPYWERLVTTEMIETYAVPEPNRESFSFSYGKYHRVAAKYLKDRPFYKVTVSNPTKSCLVAEV